MLITAVLLLINLEDKKELKSQWSVPRGFNWPQAKSYIMSQPTILSYIPFRQIQYVNKV